jgi:hypothetical protein
MLGDGKIQMLLSLIRIGLTLATTSEYHFGTAIRNEEEAEAPSMEILRRKPELASI